MMWLCSPPARLLIAILLGKKFMNVLKEEIALGQSVHNVLGELLVISNVVFIKWSFTHDSLSISCY